MCPNRQNQLHPPSENFRLQIIFQQPSLKGARPRYLPESSWTI